jgi:cytochrome c
MGKLSLIPFTAETAIKSTLEIARSYKEKEKQLTIYLNGQAESIVNPRKASMMKRYVQKTKALTPDERSALADFILSHRD